jgi:hypothetical protein
VDQYALGITAADALGELADREGVRLALLRGTAREPSERYRSIDELGTALRAALDEHAPHRLSRRLERVAPRWRATWGPAAAAAVATWAFVTVSRPPRLAWSAGLVLPLLGFLATCLALRAMAFLRADRTQPRLRIADRAWFPLLAFALALAVFLPVIRTSPGKAASHVVGCAIGALALSAYLGALSPDAGMGTVRLVRRWERWRGGRRWSGRAVLVCAAAAVAAVPGATARIWPGSVPLPGRAAAYGPLRLVAAFRDASLAGDEARACALVRVVASADRVACPRWLPLARRWLTAELGSARADRLSQRRLDDVRVSFDPDTKFVGLPYYTLRTRHGDEILGTMGPEDAARKVWMVELSHMPATGPALSGPQWRYETVRRGGRWAISSVEICDSRTRVGPDCVQLTQMRVEDFARRSADGPPRP